jgi:hypothetical protein
VDAKVQCWRVLAGLALFSIAFGYVEAAVVAYLRSIYSPLRLHFYPGSPATELFPLLSFEQLTSLGIEHVSRLKIELGREFATLAMLAGVALTVSRKLRPWLAAFLICFGIWDISFYLWLKVLLSWPASPFTWDILFLLPVPWVAPVIAPVLVSIAMICAGATVLLREFNGAPIEISRLSWAGIVVGGVLIFLAFVADFRNTSQGMYPQPFHWILFGVGEVIGILGFGASLRRRKERVK